jgi:hypothetical protein
LRALAKWTDVPTSGLLEWQVPADMSILELRGQGLRSWSRAGDRLQVWLDRPPPPAAADGPTSLELVGRRLLPADAAVLEKTAYTPPPLSLLGVATQTATVHVLSVDGWRVLPIRVAGFRPVLTADPPGVRWDGVTTDLSARAEFRIAPARGAADFDLVTIAESDGRQFVFTTTIDVLPSAAKVPEPNSVAIEMRRTGGIAAHFELPPEAKLRDTRPGPDGGTWVIDLIPGKRRLTVTTRRPIPATGDAPFPALSARALGQAPGRSRHWVAVVGSEMRGRTPIGLRLLPPPFAELPSDAKLRDALARGAMVWRAEREDWALRAQPTAAPATVPAVVPVEVTAAVDEAGHWLMEARYCLFHDSDAAWALVPDADSPVLSLTVDGRPLPEFPPTGRIPLLLPPPPGLHEVRAVWRSPMLREADRLPISLPRLTLAGEPVHLGPIVWSVVPPPGRRVQPLTGQAPFGPAARDLRHAARLDGLTQTLAGRAPAEALRPVETRIDQLLNDADAQLASEPSTDTGPNGQLLTEWLKQLRDSHPLRVAAPTRLPYDNSFDRGSATAWQTFDAVPPPFRLTDADAIPPERWLLTALFAGFFVAGIVWDLRAK